MGLFGKRRHPPSRDEFAQMVIDAIRQAGEQATVLYDPSEFRLQTDQKGGTQLFLENGYHEYCAASGDLQDQCFRRFVRGWFLTGRKAVPDEFDDARPDLLPVLRPRAYFELTRLRIQLETGSSPDWPYQILGDHLAVALAYDLPDAIQSVNQTTLDAWGVSFYEAMEAARENLSQLPCNFVGPEQGEGLYLSACNDTYDASRLLLLDAIRQMRVNGHPIAMVPNRDTLLVAGSDDIDALRAMLTLATDVLQKPRPLSGIALRLDGDEWVSWLPDASHPLYNEFRTLSVRCIGQDYHEQKDLLDKLHAKTGEHVSVASYSAVEKQDSGELVTMCIWGKHLVSLLPRTDLVAFMAPGTESVFAPWPRVCEVVGDLMKLQDMYPERHLVADFPTQEQLASMAGAIP